MQFEPKHDVVEAYALTLESIADQASWPAWMHELFDGAKLRFNSDPSKPELATLDTIGGVWAVGLDDLIVRIPSGPIYVAFPSNLFALIYQASGTAQAALAAAEAKTSGAEVQAAPAATLAPAAGV